MIEMPAWAFVALMIVASLGVAIIVGFAIDFAMFAAEEKRKGRTEKHGRKKF